MKIISRNLIFICVIVLLIPFCKKDTVLLAKDFIGTYMGNLTSTEGSDKKKSILNNCSLIITNTDKPGQVNCILQAINFPNINLIGNIEGNILILTNYEMKSNEYLYRFFGTATLNNNSITINFKEDEFKSGNLFYQISWDGSLTK